MVCLAVVEVRHGGVHRPRIGNRTCTRSAVIPSKWCLTMNNWFHLAIPGCRKEESDALKYLTEQGSKDMFVI